MAFTYALSEEHNIYPNITVEDRFWDGEPAGWRVTANEGYVFYDQNANDFELDPETNKEVPVTYYYVIRLFPSRYNWANFALVAVPRDSVDENYIFSVGNNNHEVM